jgi:hypothetical protein
MSVTAISSDIPYYMDDTVKGYLVFGFRKSREITSGTDNMK